VHLGLGLAVGAILLLGSDAHAQRPVRDSTRRDTTARQDTSVKRDTTGAVRVPVPKGADSLANVDTDTLRQPRDTIKAPFAKAEAPMLADPNGGKVWSRHDVFSTGALTVQDLLERIPGVTSLRGGWISHPMVASYLGDPRRVRVFLDGLEMQELDPRMGRMWDLTQIPLWALDDIHIERGATELRIHLRSWTVDRTTPFTRTDVYTGDQSTNLYRGLFGRRYQHGEVLQLAGQQYGTDPGRNVESSDQLGILARLGMARRLWSADAMLLRGDRNRGSAVSDPNVDTIPPTKSTRSDAYVRVGVGKPERGAWVQALAHASKYVFGGQSSAGRTTPGADTLRYESQYLLTGGYSVGPWRASFTQRFRASGGRRYSTPGARLGFDSRYVTISALGEGRGQDSTRRGEISAVVRPTSFLFVAGAVGNERPRGDSVLTPTSPYATNFTRAEAGARLRDVWFSGGVLRRDATVIEAPTIFRPETETVVDSGRQGTFAAIRGRLWKSLYADIQGIQWTDTGHFYRPKYQTRSEFYISTSMPNRFKPGHFHMLLSATHEYRSHILWPDSTGAVRLPGYRLISTLIQFRILEAEVFWQLRNVMRERYRQVPGYQLPRQSNIYGVRWEFWN
jgi:hypothetical protein